MDSVWIRPNFSNLSKDYWQKWMKESPKEVLFTARLPNEEVPRKAHEPATPYSWSHTPPSDQGSRKQGKAYCQSTRPVSGRALHYLLVNESPTTSYFRLGRESARVGWGILKDRLGMQMNYLRIQFAFQPPLIPRTSQERVIVITSVVPLESLISLHLSISISLSLLLLFLLLLFIESFFLFLFLSQQSPWIFSFSECLFFCLCSP